MPTFYYLDSQNRYHRVCWIGVTELRNQTVGHLISTTKIYISVSVMGNEHLWDRGSLYGSARGEDRTKSRSNEQHARDLPRFGLHGCVKPYSCFDCIICVLGLSSWSATVLRRYTCRMGQMSKGLNPPLSTSWASFYISRGHHRGV